MINKRGIGPLLATVILVAIAITLGALVSNYLIDKAKEFNPEKIGEESVYCESVTLGYTVTNSENFIESGPSGSQLIGPITLINRGAFSIHQLIITAPGYENRPAVNILKEQPVDSGNWEKSVIPPGEDNKYNIKIQFSPDVANEEIKIVPVIRDLEKDQLVRCPNRQLVFNYTELCTDLFDTGEEGNGFNSENPCDI